MRPHDLVLLTPPLSGSNPDHPQLTRDWLVEAHRQLQGLMPPEEAPALLTEQMTGDDGRPRDVFRYFHWDAGMLLTLGDNFYGLLQTAQTVGTGAKTNRPAPAWPGFREIEIPVGNGVHVCGRLGLAEQSGTVQDADCIVLLPGFLGDNAILRTRDLAAALREHGFHVLALELRGHGRTEARFPDVVYTFGVFETGDLLAVSEWLEAQPHIRRTGLMGNCWGANLALLTAWFDGRSENDPAISDSLAPQMSPVSARRHFTAGIIANSPVLRWEETMDRMEREHPTKGHPIYTYLQDTVRRRMIAKGYPEISGNLRKLVEFEIFRGGYSREQLEAGYDFLRLMPYRGQPAYDKLEQARVPVLILHGCTDPFVPAQEIADLMATVENPNVAAIILPGGGHGGFAAYARSYYFSLVLNFFDPRVGVAPGVYPPRRAAGEVIGVGRTA